MTLYEITSDYMQLMQMMEDPEMDPQTLADTMEGIEGELEDKADNYAIVMKNLEADLNGIKAEIDRLSTRKKTIENNIKRMKEALQFSMETTGKNKFKTELFSFGIRKNAPAVVMDEPYIENVPERFLKYSDPTINRSAIKEAIQNGEDLEGLAHLEQSTSLSIR
jgi:sugar-specific transcriptional regulator TrmB